MINTKIQQFLESFKKPNNFFLLFICLCLLNNSIFSINENFSIAFYLIIFLLTNYVKLNLTFYKIIIKKEVLLSFLIIFLPSIIFIFIRTKNGISFRGDEIAHFSNSITNLSYWFVPQNYNGGLSDFINNSQISMINLLNIKIINIFLLILFNFFIYKNFNKVFNITLFLSTLILIFFQNSFPYEYSQGSFFIDNFIQIFIYLIFPFAISESIGLTNFIFFSIYLLILRPAINNENLSYKNIFFFGILLLFPYLNILIFSNYQEGIAIVFVLLAIENFYKYKDFKKTSVLFAFAGCFREIFFLPILILFISNLILKRRNFIKKIIFYFIIISPLIIHLLHISSNSLGKKKLIFIEKLNNFSLENFYFNELLIIKIFLILLAISLSIYLFYKSKDNKFILLSFLNIPIILVLFLRHNFAFLDIDRFFYLWVIIFYIFLLFEISKINFSKKLLLFCLIIIYINNFIFMYKFYNYEIKINESQNLFLPIKDILKKENNFKKLNIYTNLEINEFSKNLYPNLEKINLYNNIKDVNKCICTKDVISLYIFDNSENIKSFCNFEDVMCKKKDNYINKIYQVYVLR